MLAPRRHPSKGNIFTQSLHNGCGCLDMLSTFLWQGLKQSAVQGCAGVGRCWGCPC